MVSRAAPASATPTSGGNESSRAVKKTTTKTITMDTPASNSQAVSYGSKLSGAKSITVGGGSAG